MNFSPIIHPWNQQIWQDLTSEPERMSHALLFSGPTGLGKQDLGLGLAHFMLTDAHTHAASLFDAGSHPDLHIICPENKLSENLQSSYAQRYLETHSGKPKQSITIEQIRRLSEALTTHPHVSQMRVVIVYYVEALNRNAANALLKSLEEPPANTLFVLISDDINLITKTILSRCNIIPFRTPDTNVAETWLHQQNSIPKEHIKSHIAAANNQPLEAIRLYQENYIDHLKSIFTSLNALWSKNSNPVKVASEWREIGGGRVVDTLQKVVVDILKLALSENASGLFFPVQQSWSSKVSAKLDRARLVVVFEQLNAAKKQLSTPSDELLILESVANEFYQLS